MEEKRYSIALEYMPIVLRGIGGLFFSVKDSQTELVSDSMFALDCILGYIADDMETQVNQLIFKKGEKTA